MSKGLKKIIYNDCPNEWASILERVANPEYHVYAINTADIQPDIKHEYHVMVGGLKCVIAKDDIKYLEDFMKAPTGIIQKKTNLRGYKNTILVALCNVYWSKPLKRYIGIFVSSEQT